MKKFILIIILLLPVNIYAKEYYTNYIYEKESTKKEPESALVKVEKSRIYANYQIIKEDFGYQKEENCHANINYEDSKIIKEYNSSDMYGTGKTTNALLGTDDIIRYIIIRQYPYENQNKRINISNIEVSSKEINIEYDSFKDVEYKDQKFFLILDLKKGYHLNDLNVVIFYDAFFDEDFVYNFDFSKKKLPPYLGYVYKIETKKNSNMTNLEFYNLDEFNQIIKTSPSLISNPSDNSVSYYYNESKIFKCTKEEIIYSENYTETPPKNYYQDKERYQDIYKYYKREVFDIKDEINSVEDYITLINSSLSSSKYQIETNLDITKEGTYLIKINYLDNTIYHKVKLNQKIINIPKEITSLPNNTVNKEISKPQIKQETIKNNHSKKLLVNKTEDQKIPRTTIKTSENTQKVLQKESKIKSHFICILITILLIFVLIIQKIKTSFVESV
ncbi:MAG: hypothetical protein Q4C44_02300 [bacterium]|nr:hypothetical protein [bacterium]